MSVYRSILEAPRWAGAPALIKDLAFLHDLKLNIDVDKGWLRETVRFSVEGKELTVNEFRRQLADSLQDYQRQIKQ